MKKLYLKSYSLLWLLIIVVLLALNSVFVVQAEEFVGETPRTVFLNVLEKYKERIISSDEWDLGEIQKQGKFAFAIAKNTRVNGEQGILLLLAEKVGEKQWRGLAPGLVSPKKFNTLLASFPEELLSEFEKSYYYQYSPAELSPTGRAVSLHHFPWPIDQTAILTQKDGSYHANQVDFVIRDSADIYASKPGTVIFVKEVSNTGGCDIDYWQYANLVVVQHAVGEFSWYFHLKKDSATVKVGDQIGYGTKIGEQGNTGYACGSTGIHLHFMVSNAIPTYWPDPAIASLAPWPPGGSIIPVDFIESTWSALKVSEIYLSKNTPSPGGCPGLVSAASFYDGTYCSSLIFQKGSPNLYVLKNLGAADKIESLALPAGWSIKLYKDENESGASLCLNATDEMLWDNKFSDLTIVSNNASWIRLFSKANCPIIISNYIQFYNSTNYTGDVVWSMAGARFTNGPHHLVSSIRIPSGWSARLWDQDNRGGNSICLPASNANLTAINWNNRFIESIELFNSQNCGDDPNLPNTPVLTTPVNGAVIYGLYAPKLCWKPQNLAGIEFYAMISDGTVTYNSGWISDTCWRPKAINGLYANYSWKVLARNSLDQRSSWSASKTFNYTYDSDPPIISFEFPVAGDALVKPRDMIVVNASDGETGMYGVHFLAWYDDGTDNGYDWHYLGFDSTGSDGWHQVWNLTEISKQDVALWVYAEDKQGNYGYDYLTGIPVIDSSDGGGYLPRDGRTENPEETQGEFLSPPNIEEFLSEITEIHEEIIDTSEEEELSEYSESNENEMAGNSGANNTSEEQSDGNAPVGNPEDLNITIVPEPPQIDTSIPSQDQYFSIISPVEGLIYWGDNLPDLCWNIEGDQQYRARITGGGIDIDSGWIGEACWQPAIGIGNYGEFVLNVETQSGNNQAVTFSVNPIESDGRPPLVSFRHHDISGEMLVVIDDKESGVLKVSIVAYFDDGSGAGKAWHLYSKVVDSKIRQLFVWDTQSLPAEPEVLLVYAEDWNGNLTGVYFNHRVPEFFWAKSIFDLEGLGQKLDHN